MEQIQVNPAIKSDQEKGLGRGPPNTLFTSPSGITYETDEFGIAYYCGPPPGLDWEATQMYDVWMPHIDCWYFSDVAQNKHHGNVVYINPYKGMGRGPRIQMCTFDETPLRCPFGQQVGMPESKKAGKDEPPPDPNRPNLSMTVEGAGAKKFFEKLDEKTMAVARDRFRTWGTEKKATNMDVLYKSLIRDPPAPKQGEAKKDYKSTFRTKLTIQGNNATNVYRKVGERIIKHENGTEEKKLQLEICYRSGSCPWRRVVPTVEIASIWFMGGRFGINLQCTDIIIIPHNKTKDRGFVGMDIEIVTPAQQIPPAMPAANMLPGGSGQVPSSSGGGEVVDHNDYMATENNPTN